MKHKQSPRRYNGCKVCASGLSSPINEMLARRVQQREIVRWANQQKPELLLSPANLCRHNKLHRPPSTLELSPTDLATIKSADTKKPLPATNEAAEQAKDANTILALEDFLDLVIDKVQKAISDNSLIPTVTEGVKAAEIKAKIKSDSPFEKTLIQFFLGMSKDHGFHNQA